MSQSTISGYAAKSLGQPLEPFTYKPPKLGESEVRVSVTHCGVCHTDLHSIDDYYFLAACISTRRLAHSHSQKQPQREEFSIPSMRVKTT